MGYEMNQFSVMALLSGVLYASLAITAGYYYWKLRQPSVNSDGKPATASVSRTQMTKSKLTFFSVLLISATFDVPLYIGCLAMQGPLDCEWNTVSYTLCWVLHLLALVGYAITMGIPLFLWSDIHYGRDGNLFSRKYPDFSKLFLHLSIACYFILQIMTSLTVLITADNPSKYKSSMVRKVASLAEPMVIFVIAAIWLWSGVRLQVYIVNVCFRPADERKILFTINVVLFTILCSYLLRAIMVVSLYTDYHTHTLHFLNYSYIGWVIGTRWIPYIMCSYLLIFLMKRSVSTVDAVTVTDTETFLPTAVPILDGKSGKSRRGSSLNNVVSNNRSAASRDSDDYLPQARLRQAMDSLESGTSHSGSASNSFTVDDYDNQYRVHSCDVAMENEDLRRAMDASDSSSLHQPLLQLAVSPSQSQLPSVDRTSNTSNSSNNPGATNVRAPLIENSRVISSLIL
jgi:hypothetical protein